MKKFLITFIALMFILPVFAYEDCIITTDGKLTDIKIQYNDVIDVFPLITVMNEKNTLIVHPLKLGQTKFTVLKNNKDKYLFNVKVDKNGTFIDEVNGFEIFTIDCPPTSDIFDFELDAPPIIYDHDDYIDNLDEPPILRGEE